MARRRAVSRARPGLVSGGCECWMHDHPHPSAYPWHRESRRFLAVDKDGFLVRQVPEEERRAALLDAGCATCTAVAGGTWIDYLDRMGRPRQQ